MKEWELKIGRTWNSDSIAQAIESTLRRHGLLESMKGELRSYPDCLRWHFKKQRESGTIEVTMWPKERRVWFNVHSGRNAQWIERDLPIIVDDLQQALSKEQ